MGSSLFSDLRMRGVLFRNRIGVSPMCQYSSTNGFVNDWHLVHLGSRAVGGAGFVFTEACAVEAIGRITSADLGLYLEEHVTGLTRVASFIKAQGAVAGIQLAHAGRKGSSAVPWGDRESSDLQRDGWVPVAPSAIAFDKSYRVPSELSPSEIDGIVRSFQLAAARAQRCGFDLIEIHAAHGYLLHEFLSPLSNSRDDAYGGPRENRYRLLLEVVRAVREVISVETVLAVRISATDWVEGGWGIDDSVALSRQLKLCGVDFVDCSSGGNVPRAQIPAAAGYQVPFAKRIREEAEIATAAVGLILESHQANDVIESGAADFVLLGREMLRDPYWPRRAASELNYKIRSPNQYQRGWEVRT